MDPYKEIAENAVREHALLLQHSLQLLEAAKKEPYYDSRLDELNRTAYYKGIRMDTPGEKEMYQQLSALLKKTHTTGLTYDDARHKHLYVKVDLQPNNMLKSIYSGEEFAPEKIIADDLDIAQQIMELARQQFSTMANMNEAAFTEHLAFLKATATYNAEHTVPQSWFSEKYPMKSDLHHLFTCETTCNEFRANVPFFDFADFEERIRRGCGKKEENKFEPFQGHGAVARATLYFLLRYPKEISNNAREYTRERIQVLLKWNKSYPVNQYELHRNAEIYRVQGNRNPLIDHPEWSTKIDFASGLG